jgi:Zn-dependent peptidase ImmA (M78 family)
MIDLDNFPELLDEQIEKKSQELIMSYQDDSDWLYTAPMPVERIAQNHLGYDIEITNEGLFEDPDFLGGIHFNDKLIQVNGSIEDHDGRYSFTVAHELGHHCLHRDRFNEISKSDEIMCRDGGEKPIAERQADKFAAYLLMPTNLVNNAYKKAFGDDNKVFEMDFKKRYMLSSIARRVIDAGAFTNVSLTAMTNRLIGMGLITGINYQKSVMPERLNNGFIGYLSRLYKKLQKLINNNK